MRPDIVLVMTDQQRFDQVGWLSDGAFETPALDALAAAGVRFDTAYSAGTTCLPARNALLTGVQPHRLPPGDPWPALAPGVWTVARALRDAGYETALIGKMHFTPVHADHGFETIRAAEHLQATVLGLRPDGTPDVDDYHQHLVDLGLARWGELVPGAVMSIEEGSPPPDRDGRPFPWDLEHHATTWIEREVHAFLDARAGGRPLFLVVSFPHPHTPVNPLGPYRTMYDPATTPLPREDLSVNDGLPEPFRAAFTEVGRRYAPWRVDQHGEETLRRLLTGVRGLVRQIDDTLGRLLARLDLGRTVVTFTTDHGDYAGHRGVGMKMPWIPFEDLVRTPLVVAGAGVARGRAVTVPVQTMDLPLTFCELAGVEVPLEDFDGCSLVPHLDGRPDPPEERPVVFATSAGWPGARYRAVKQILHPESWTGVTFHLGDDPGERVDRGDDPALAEEREVLVDALRAAFARPRLARFWPGACEARPTRLLGGGRRARTPGPVSGRR